MLEFGLRGVEAAGAAADQLLVAVPDQLFELPVAAQDDAVAGDDDADRGGIEDRLHFAVEFGDFFGASMDKLFQVAAVTVALRLSGFERGDVVTVADVAEKGTRGAVARRTVVPDPAVVAVGMA